MTTKEQLERGKGNWEKLFDFMDENDFTCFDFLVCICAQLLHTPENEFEAQIKLKSAKFKITIKRKL